MIGALLFIAGSFFVMGPGVAWDTLFINPLINSLLLLTNVVAGQFGVAIILFTIILRVATIPFTLRQLQSTRAMQEMQPRMQEIQKKYKDPKRRQEETLKLYKETGINPLGCVMPMAIQMLVFFALYRALAFVVGGSPESLVGLSQRVYPWSYLTQSVPLEQSFLWLGLGGGGTNVLLPPHAGGRNDTRGGGQASPPAAKPGVSGRGAERARVRVTALEDGTARPMAEPEPDVEEPGEAEIV